MEDGAVVVEADPLPLALDQLEEAVLLEGEADELVDRVTEDCPDDDCDREKQEVRPCRGDYASTSKTPPPGRPEGRSGGGVGAGRELATDHAAPILALSVQY